MGKNNKTRLFNIRLTLIRILGSLFFFTKIHEEDTEKHEEKYLRGTSCRLRDASCNNS